MEHSPLGVGIAFNLIADMAFKKKRTTVKPFIKSSALITNGVFQISRHPMYLGMVLILLGIDILLGSVTPVGVVILFAMVMEFVFVQAEEIMLEEQYGPEWLVYKRR